MSLLTSNTAARITTYIESSTMPTPRQLMPNSRPTMSTKDSKCFNIFPLSWATSWSVNASIQCRSACLTSSRSEVSATCRLTNSWIRTMPSGYPCLLTKTSHHQISHMKKFLNGMGRRWKKWAGTCLQLYRSLYEAAALLSAWNALAELSAHWDR